MNTNVTNQEIDAAIKRLMITAKDPMWADHVEFPKLWCTELADLLRRIRKERSGDRPRMPQMQG